MTTMNSTMKMKKQERTLAPIAPPEQTPKEETSEAKQTKRATRETKDWFMILDPETDQITLEGFGNLTELRKYLEAVQGREVIGDFKVRGWAKPFKKTMTVRF